MSRKLLVLAISVLPLSAHVIAAQKIPAAIEAAVADPARPADDRAHDAHRKPAGTLAVLGLKPGQSIYELFPGKGYYTRILGVLVGPGGQLIAVPPTRRPDADPAAADPGAAVQALSIDPHYANIRISHLVDHRVTVPAPVDVVWTSLNYHDLHNVPNIDLADFNRSVFDALKPGGLYVVIDHAAAAGHGAQDTSTLHRIEAATVRQEVTAVGFKLVKESHLLGDSADDHTRNVHDPAVQGQTDQFILEFRKP